MSNRFNLAPSPLYRRLGPGPALTLALPSGALRVEPGDWIDQTLVQRLDKAGRARLGPTMSAPHVERETGARPEQGQHHVRAGKRASTVPEAAAPNVGVYLVDVEGEAAEQLAKRVRATAHVPVLIAWGPSGWDALRECDISVEVRPGDRLGTGWLAASIQETYDEGALAGGGMLQVWLEAGRPVEAHRAAIAAKLDGAPEGLPVLLVEEGTWLDQNSADRLAFLLAESKATAVLPAHNLGEPYSLPSPGETGSPWPRLPGGKHPRDIADALLADGAPPVPGRPERPGAVLLRRDVAERLARGEAVELDPAICMTAFCWRSADTSGPLTALLGPPAPQAWPWAPVVDRARRAVAASKPRGLPVALYTSNVGPWGGVAVLFRLADELQHLGVAAAVVHHNTTEHRLRSMTSPLKVRNPNALITDWPGETGWREGILVASHWGSGRGVQEIVARHPGVIPTSFLQDREDLFEDESGRPAGMSKFGEYLRIGRGVSVARWILDSAAGELGLKPEGYQVIQPGVDCEVFRPAPQRASGGPIRIVAMWRPQTAIRRGIGRLRATYEALHRRFGARVSLEVFGWNAPSGPGRAPDFVRHHGHLSQLEVAALMAQADIVVEPSDFQGYGLPGLEAMACGAALVSTACRGVDEYAVDGQNALVVPHDGLAEAVARVVDDDELRQRLQAAGPETALRFNWPLVAARWVLYLRDLWISAGGAEVHRDALDRAEDRARGVLG